MKTHSPREQAEQSGTRTMPGDAPGGRPTPDTHGPPNKPGQYTDEPDSHVARDPAAPRSRPDEGRDAGQRGSRK
jgi:hypothetical protein